MKKNRAKGSNVEENVGRAVGVESGSTISQMLCGPQHSHITLKLDFD